MASLVSRLRRSSGSLYFASRANALFFVAFSTANVCSFLFHLSVSRRLPPADYGALGALLGITVVLLVPVGALQTAMTQAMAPRLRGGDGRLEVAVAPMLGTAVLWAIGIFVTFSAVGPLLRSFLHLASFRSIVLLAACIIPIVIGLVPKAILMAQLRFTPFAGALVAGAFIRLALANFLVSRGYGVDGALAATVLAEVATTAIALVPLRHEFKHNPGSPVLIVPKRDSAMAIAAFTGFWALTVVDVLLARHLLSRASSGFYAAASTAASSVLFLVGAVSATAFPRFAATGGRGVSARRCLVQALGLVALLCLPAAAFFAAFPKLIVAVLFGPQYAPASSVLVVLAAAATALAGIQVLLHFLIARRSILALLPWLAVTGAAAAILALGTSMASIAITMAATTGILSVWMLVAALRPAANEVATAHRGLLFSKGTEPALELTVVVPYFNPGPRFRPSLERLMSVLAESGITTEIITVSDGSTDGSPAAVRDLASESVRMVELDHNSGKGEALRIGLSQGRGRYLGFIDADGDIDADQVRPFIELMRLYQPDIIMGSKRHPMSAVNYPRLRRAYSWVYQRLCSVLFRLNVRDTQTGLKFVRREVLAETLPLMIEKRYAFDLELLVVARHLGYRKFFEAPIRLNERFSSTINRRAVQRMLIDTIAIFYRLRILRYYDRPTPAIITPPVSIAQRDGHREQVEAERP